MNASRSSILGSALVAMTFSSACGDGDGAAPGGGDGKGDGLGDLCASAALDPDGVCRADDGTFAETTCCAQDVVDTSLWFDVTSRVAVATVTMAASTHRAVVLEVGDLAITAVNVDGAPGTFTVAAQKVVVPVDPDPGVDHVLVFEYGYTPHENFDGFIDAPLSDMSFTWPEFCGNLFPCISAPADGIPFSMDVAGVPAGQTAVFPARVDADGPSYMPAFAVAEYGYERLGVTTDGTEVGAYYLPGGQTEAATAAAGLTTAFDFFEQTYGAYTFGEKVASVAVDWGEGDFGGMEHHPLWHIARGSFARPDIHIHEAAHGWYGDGVRIACREDFVLSEGVTTYLESRGREVAGEDYAAIYAGFQTRMEASLMNRDFVVYPDGCNEIATLFDIFTGLPYMKGAFFLREVENRIGRATLDAALAGFYQANVGKAAHMQDLIDHIARTSKQDISDLATGWLRSTGVPCVLVGGVCQP